MSEGLNRLKNAGFLLVLGLLSGLSMPPVDAWWVLFFTFPTFTVLVNSRSSQTFGANFFCGWFFGFGYFLSVLHWIGFAFLVNAKDYLWMMPLAVGGLAGGLAVFWGVATAAAQKCVKRGWHGLFAYPLSFGIAEFLRGHIFTGFPWAVPGLATDGMGGVEQLASVIGMNGLTIVMLLWALTPLGFFVSQRRIRFLSTLILASLPLCWLWGEWRLAANPAQYIEGQIVRLVQPNISQDDKWRGDNARVIFDQLLKLSSQTSTGAEPTLIVWPESAVPFLIDESAEGKAELRNMLGAKKTLLTGAVRRSSPDGTGAEYFTSILAFDAQAAVIGTYDKHHLVPGGEYLPLAWLLEPLGFRKVVNVPESFTAGTGPTVLPLEGVGRVAMQICYEAIFPASIPSGEKRPDWLLNVTNDGWFGNSAGPYQHVAQVRMRAIEQGVGVVRVANTGISAVLDSTGSYLVQSQIGKAVAFDSPVPRAMNWTVFSLGGDFGLFVLGCLIFALAHASRVPGDAKVLNKIGETPPRR